MIKKKQKRKTKNKKKRNDDELSNGVKIKKSALIKIITKIFNGRSQTEIKESNSFEYLDLSP